MATFLRMDNFRENINKCEQFACTVQAFEFITPHRQDVKMSKIQEWEAIERLFVEAAIIANRQHSSRPADLSDDISMGSGNSNEQRLSTHTACSLGSSLTSSYSSCHQSSRDQTYNEGNEEPCG